MSSAPVPADAVAAKVASIYDRSVLERHLGDRQTCKEWRSAAQAGWWALAS